MFSLKKLLAGLLAAFVILTPLSSEAAFDKYKKDKGGSILAGAKSVKNLLPGLVLASVVSTGRDNLPDGFLAQLEAHIAENLQKAKKFYVNRRDDESAYQARYGDEKTAMLLTHFDRLFIAAAIESGHYDEGVADLSYDFIKAADSYKPHMKDIGKNLFMLCPEAKAAVQELSAAEDNAKYFLFLNLRKASSSESSNIFKSGSKVELTVDYYLVNGTTGLVYHNTDRQGKSAFKYTLVTPNTKMSFGKSKESAELINTVVKKQAERIAKDIEKTGLPLSNREKAERQDEDDEDNDSEE